MSEKLDPLGRIPPKDGHCPEGMAYDAGGIVKETNLADGSIHVEPYQPTAEDKNTCKDIYEGRCKNKKGEQLFKTAPWCLPRSITTREPPKEIKKPVLQDTQCEKTMIKLKTADGKIIDVEGCIWR